MAFGIANFEQLPYYIQVAMEDMEVHIQALLRNVQTDVLASVTSPPVAQEGRWWRTPGPWLLDDPQSSTPDVVVLPQSALAGGTYHNFAPQGIDDAVIVDINPEGGDVVLTGIKARAGMVKRIMGVRNADPTSRLLTLKDDNTGSLEPYRFNLPNNQDVILGPNQMAWMYYNRNPPRWHLFVTPHQSGGIATGGAGVDVAIKDLTESQIEAFDGLDATGIEVVAAPGAGKIVVPILFMVQLVVATGYTNTQTWTINWNGLATPNLTGSVTTQFSSTGTKFGKAADVLLTITAGTDPSNRAIEVNLAAALTGSGSATARVWVYYVTVTQP